MDVFPVELRKTIQQRHTIIKTVTTKTTKISHALSSDTSCHL